MLQRIMKISAILMAVLLAAGCASRVPLTRALIKEYNLTMSDVKRLQLYISDDVLLEQQAKSINKDIDQTHSLKKVEDQYIKQIHFKAMTPCIPVEASADRLQVSFEPVDNLTFVYDMNTGRGEGYILHPERKPAKEELPEHAQNSIFYNWKIIGQETYGDSLYNVIVKNDIPVLLVDQASLKNFLIESRTVPGMKQSDIDNNKMP